MFGYYNRVLTIDLTTKSATTEPVTDQVLAECFGGKGLATRLLLERNKGGVDPLSPNNHLIFAQQGLSAGDACGGQAGTACTPNLRSPAFMPSRIQAAEYLRPSIPQDSMQFS